MTMRQLLCLLFISAFWLPLSARAEAAPPAVPSIAVRMVHPDSLELDREGKPVPEGYTPYVYEFRDRHVGLQHEFLDQLFAFSPFAEADVHGIARFVHCDLRLRNIQFQSAALNAALI